jgi:hypothetical protein
LSIVHRPSSIVHRPSSIVHRPSSIVHRPSSIIHRPSSIVHRPPSIVAVSLLLLDIFVTAGLKGLLLFKWIDGSVDHHPFHLM